MANKNELDEELAPKKVNRKIAKSSIDDEEVKKIIEKRVKKVAAKNPEKSADSNIDNVDKKIKKDADKSIGNIDKKNIISNLELNNKEENDRNIEEVKHLEEIEVDLDNEITRKFDSQELKREMERMARVNRSHTASKRAMERKASEEKDVKEDVSRGDELVMNANRTGATGSTSRTGTTANISRVGMVGGTSKTNNMGNATRTSSIENENRANMGTNRGPAQAKRKKSKKSKKSSGFKKFMKKYILVLCILFGIFLGYVMNTLYQYEDSFTDNYMKVAVKDITKTAKKGKISKICDTQSSQVNKLDSSNTTYDNAFKEIFNNSEITYKLEEKTKNSDNPVYYIYANNNKVMEVKLKVKERKHRLGLFTYPVWNIDTCKMASDRGLNYYDVYVPSNYIVEVNGTKLDESYISNKTVDEDYEKFIEYVKLPAMVNYELNNFVKTPSIKIKDEKGKEVNWAIKDNKIEIANAVKKVSTYEEAKNYITGNIDILKLAENWSLFLTDDLRGGTQHGFSLLKPYLIKNSNFYNMAYAWATSIDITFVSSHTLKNPTFTNESLTDFVIYGENAFSCSVNLEKNMRIANGKDKVDVMHDRLYFVYYDDTNDGVNNPSWKLIDMKSIVDKK